MGGCSVPVSWAGDAVRRKHQEAGREEAVSIYGRRSEPKTHRQLLECIPMLLRCFGGDNMKSQETESRWEQLCSWERRSVTGQPTGTKERAPRGTSCAEEKMQPISRSRNLPEGYDLQTEPKGLVVVPIVASGRRRLGRGFRPGGRFKRQ